MTPDQMAELAARLRVAADSQREYSQSLESLLDWAADLDRAADLIAGMAQRVPLSDEEIWALWDYSPDMSWKTSVINLGHAIEQAHGIRSEK